MNVCSTAPLMWSTSRCAKGRATPIAVVLAILVLAGIGCAPEVVVGHAPVPGNDAGDGDGAADAEPSIDASDAGGDASDAGDASNGSDASDASDPARPPPEITWQSGGHPGNDYPQYVDFGDWRGRPTEVASVFPDRASWDGIVTPAWPVNMFAPFEGLLILSLPLYPEGLGNTQDCAAGMYDAQWARLGTFLADRGRGDAIVRLGWGPNDNDHLWAVVSGATPDSVDQDDLADWIVCFRRVVDAARSTAPALRIDWTINPIGAPWIATFDPYLAYPGDEYVDYVGLEVFDMYPSIRDEDDWEAVCNSLTGLCTLATFARARGKQIGVAEWGVVGCNGDGQPDQTGNTGGDNPFFVQKVVETFADNADVMAYDAYFEDGGREVCSNISDGTSNPQSAEKYRELYGIRDP